MRIIKIEINNFRSFSNVTIEPESILCLVGRNNSGKSNVLKAIELFFESTVRLINNETFLNCDTTNPVEIILTFTDLSLWEKNQFEPWMDGDILKIGKRVVCEGIGKFNIQALAFLKVPEPSWLNQTEINGDSISEWWANKDTLVIGDLNFGATLGERKPRVGEWKDAAKAFVETNRDDIPMVEEVLENPKGYPGVLKGALPEFIYVPAVKDVLEEAKVLKTSPFGLLMNSILGKITEQQKATIEGKMKDIEELLNRSDGARLEEIQAIENLLNTLMAELMECDIEIEINLPKLHEIFTGTKIYANDGTRTTIEMKGHGLQRAMILTILRAYADISHRLKAGTAADQRTTIFAIEEPELYLHPQSQRTLVKVFRDIASSGDQVLYSTHSNLCVDVTHFDEICIMRRKADNGQPVCIPTQLKLPVLLEDLRLRGITGTEEGIRALYSNVFNPLVNEGFFADKIVIVEGPSELYSLPIYSSALGVDLDRENIAVVHCDGKGPIDRLIRIFSGFGIPTFVWFDGDKENDDEKVKRKTLELLELLGNPLINIGELQTTVSDNFCVLEKTLEDTLRSEIPDYDDVCREATNQIGPHGKPIKHKFIATKKKELVDNGEPREEVIPKTVQLIVEKVVSLDTSLNVLQSD